MEKVDVFKYYPKDRGIKRFNRLRKKVSELEEDLRRSVLPSEAFVKETKKRIVILKEEMENMEFPLD